MGADDRLTQVCVMLKWPAKSPDLNPIEIICAEIKMRFRRRHFEDEEELFEAIQNK
jgi:transposase